MVQDKIHTESRTFTSKTGFKIAGQKSTWIETIAMTQSNNWFLQFSSKSNLAY